MFDDKNSVLMSNGSSDTESERGASHKSGQGWFARAKAHKRTLLGYFFVGASLFSLLGFASFGGVSLGVVSVGLVIGSIISLGWNTFFPLDRKSVKPPLEPDSPSEVENPKSNNDTAKRILTQLEATAQSFFEFDIPLFKEKRSTLFFKEHINPKSSYSIKTEPYRLYLEEQSSQTAQDKFKNFTSNHLSSFLQAYKNAREHAPSLPSVCILGMGPTGLIAALRAYQSGATVTIIDKRDRYTRENVLRVSDDFLLGGDAQEGLANSLLLKTPMSYLSLFSLGFQGVDADGLFRAEVLQTFRTIETKELEAFLFYLLNKLRESDEGNIKIFQGHEILDIKPIEGEIVLKDSTPLKADWIVDATGAQGRLSDGTLITNKLYPIEEEAYEELSGDAPYIAATFNGGRSDMARGRRNSLPELLTEGAARLKEEMPLLSDKLNARITLLKRPIHRMLTTLPQLGVLYGNTPKETYLKGPFNIQPSSEEDLNMDLACVNHGLKGLLAQLSPLGWLRERLPLVRQLTTDHTTYVGMEVPPALFNRLVLESEPKQQEALFLQWIKLNLKPFFPQNFIETLSLRQGSAFSFKMRTKKRVMYEYPKNNTKVFSLGDALVPPHFLTGSGLESAALSVDYWIKYLKTPAHSQEASSEYIDDIKTKVQDSAIDKAMVRLNPFSLLPEHNKADSPDDIKEQGESVRTNLGSRAYS